MRRILTSVVLLVLLFPSLAMGETMDDLVFRFSDGLYYKKFTEISFSGKVTGSIRYSSRSYRVQRSVKNGMKHGLWVTYWDNGRLESKVTYKDGKADGPWVFYYEIGRIEEK